MSSASYRLRHSHSGHPHSRQPHSNWRALNHSLAQWERYTEWPMVAAALLFLAAYAIPIIWPNLNHWLLNYSNHVIIVTWAIFGIDYLIRLFLARDKFNFFKHNLVDLCSIVLPLMRPLRLLRLVAALSVLNRMGILTLRGRVISYAFAATAVITFAGSLTVTQVERAAGGNIQNFGDGLWWALVTVASVGYGDFYPITLLGRTVAVILMLTGVMLVGAVSASLASWLVQHTMAAHEVAAETTPDDVEAMLSQMQDLNTQVTSLNSAMQRHAATIRSTRHLGTP